MSHISENLAGYRWVKFNEEELARGGWDVTWDLDNIYKMQRRANVPRILSAIRLTGDGHPAVDEQKSREKVLASIYVEPMNKLVRAVYDPNYADPVYRYRTQVWTINWDVKCPDDPQMILDESESMGSLDGVLRNFYAYWIENRFPDPLYLFKLKTAGKGSKPVVPPDYVDKGFGLFS